MSSTTVPQCILNLRASHWQWHFFQIKKMPFFNMAMIPLASNVCSRFISHLSQSCPSASAVSALTMGLQLAILLLAVAKQQRVDTEARKTYAIHNTVHHFPPKIKNKITKYLTRAAVWSWNVFSYLQSRDRSRVWGQCSGSQVSPKKRSHGCATGGVCSTPVCLQVFCQVFASIFELVFIQNYIKHFLITTTKRGSLQRYGWSERGVKTILIMLIL